MKLEQISNNLTLVEGNWVAKSLDGVEKRFPTADTAGRDAWAQSYAKAQKSDTAPLPPEQQGPDLDTVWRKVQDVIFNIFPDGDPIDWLIPWFEKQGIKDFKIGDMLNRAAQKNGYEDIYDYYDQLKKDFATDAETNEGAHANTIGAIASYAPDPKPGDTIRTRKMQMQGKVEKVEPYQGYMAVYFRTQDDRLMRTPLSNVIVIEKLADSEIEEVNETFPYDVDHMSDKTVEGEFENKTVRYFYNEWKELADRANSEQHNNNLVISSGPTTVIYQGDDGTIYAQWDKKKKVGFIKGKTTESMGGIPRFDRRTGLMGIEPRPDNERFGVFVHGKLLKTFWSPEEANHYADGYKRRNPGIETTVKNLDSASEGSMGGINRSAPAQDVSYEKVLDEVMSMWKEACRTDELSVDTMQNYRKAATSPAAVKTRPLRKLAKTVVGVKRAGDKIASKTGDRTGNRPKYGKIHTGTFEERLAEFLNMDEDFDASQYADILSKQYKDDQKHVQKKRKIVPIDYHGWTIKYREPGAQGDIVDWVIYDKKGNTVKKGEATSSKDAVRQAQDFINQGGGTKQQATSNVTIDFNVDFAREFAPSGDSLYVNFDKDGNTPVLIVSLVPQDGFKKTHIRNQKHKMTATTTGLPMVTLSSKESNSLGLQPNGRYLLGSKDPIDDNTALFPLIFQGIVQGKGDMARMGKPGLTVAHNREVDEDCWYGYKQVGMKEKNGKQVPNCVPTTNEVYQGPWQGDPEKYAKAPKSTSWGKDGVTLSQMVQDTIDEHGVKWAFEYYVKKHGMPPRHFRIYAGL
jgi:hypothetical protein